MSDFKDKSVQIDFDAIAAEDAKHFETFKISPADILLIGGFALLFLVVFLQFFTRYVLNDSISWTEEAARYLLIMVTFAGAVRCQIQGTHIVLEFMDRYYGRFETIVRKFALIATILLFTVLAFACWELIQKTSFQQMVSLPFPKYYLHALVLVFIGLNGAAALIQLLGGFNSSSPK